MTATKTAKAKKPVAKDYRLIRQKLRLNQSDFWSRIGVTQSGGSRYESGRAVPKPTATLVTLAYETPAKALEALAKLRGTTVADLIAEAK